MNIKYAIFTDSHGKWRIMAVPVQPSSFESRLPLPEAWRGLRDDEVASYAFFRTCLTYCSTLQLSEKCGIPGGIFVHASGFIGGNETKVC